MEEDVEIPKKAKKFIKTLDDISYKIDEFVDLTLHSEIRDVAEKERKEKNS